VEIRGFFGFVIEPHAARETLHLASSRLEEISPAISV
jgi:hypothetical protein